MVQAKAHPTDRSAPATDPAHQAEAGQARQAPEAAEEEGSPVTRKTRDAIILGFAQNAILAGLIILAAGVPTW